MITIHDEDEFLAVMARIDQPLGTTDSPEFEEKLLLALAAVRYESGRGPRVDMPKQLMDLDQIAMCA